MKNLTTTLLMLLMLLCSQSSFAQSEIWTRDYKTLEASIKEPTFGEKTYSITKYGAKTNATAAKNQKAINKAIADCSKKGGGMVTVPAGVWNTGAITLLAGVNLHLEKDAVIRFAFDRDLYPNVLTRWEGLDCINYQPCIYAYRQDNIGITGEGTIDGAATWETWWPMCGKSKAANMELEETQRNPDGRPLLLKQAEDGVDKMERVYGKGRGLRPQLVNLYECNGILIEGVKMTDSPFWVMHPLLSKNIVVRNVTVVNDGPNGDGCDPESCENVLIEGCTFQTGDDCIAIKSGRNADGRLWNVPSKNIIIRNCSFKDGHGGVVLGSEISGGCQNVYVENCEMDSPNLDRVLRIKTNPCRGGIIENVYFKNVKVGQCKEAVLKINLDYEPKEICCRDYPPTVRNVYMENVTCQKSRYGIMAVGLQDVCNVYNVNLKNCQFNGVTDEPVYKTGQMRDFNYDGLKINGKVILDKPTYDTYSEWMTYSEMTRVAHPYMLDFAKKPKWSYVMGIEMEGMLNTYLEYKDNPKNEAIINYLHEYAKEMIEEDGTIKTYKIEDYNLDQIRTGKYILRMEQLYPEAKNKKACDVLWKQLQQQPRTKQGVWFHKAIYANQVWLDGIFMGLPFYCNYAKTYLPANKAVKIYDDAVKQVLTTDKYTYDEKTALWKHAWDSKKSIFWADKETGLSQHTWARAQGWYAMALTEIIDAMPEDYAGRQKVIDLLVKVLTQTVKYQDAKTGVWYDVMDCVGREGNYLESTASCMFAYCLLKAARNGFINEELKQAGLKAYKGIINEFVQINEDKTISLTRCCEVSGLGPENNPRRDGSFEYYISEKIRDNDAKGVGPFIWASLEMERMGYNVEKLTAPQKKANHNNY